MLITMSVTEVIHQVAAETELEPEAVERVVSALAAHNGQGRPPVTEESIAQLIEALMPQPLDVPTPAAVLQARRNAQARTALLREFGALRSGDVATLAGSRAQNRAALANRWRAEDRVLAVSVGDELLYPGYQFTSEGRPHPTVARALTALRAVPGISDWQAALWFAAPTGWLGGRRPVDLLDDDPEAVIEAAEREVSAIAA
jgi:hypothetical protein